MPLHQHHLSFAIDEAVHHQLFSSAPSVRARALANSTSLSHAGSWLNGVPSAALGPRLQDKEFRSCLRYWLGIPLHSAPYSCPECHRTADEFGDHQVGCAGNATALHATMPSVTFFCGCSICCFGSFKRGQWNCVRLSITSRRHSASNLVPCPPGCFGCACHLPPPAAHPS